MQPKPVSLWLVTVVNGADLVEYGVVRVDAASAIALV